VLLTIELKLKRKRGKRGKIERQRGVEEIDNKKTDRERGGGEI
jgi:hypothetical protein